MEIFGQELTGKYYAVRLDKGDDLLESFQSFLERYNIADGVVVSGIGTLDQCHMHFVTTINDATKMEFKRWKDTPLEVASIDGIVANGEPHLHMVISNTDRAWAGHVEPGCRTLYLCEIMFIELPGFNLDRKRKTSDENHSDYYIKNLIQKNIG
jgi:predicted DNA-binding protein with PD1-like motif